MVGEPTLSHLPARDTPFLPFTLRSTEGCGAATNSPGGHTCDNGKSDSPGDLLGLNFSPLEGKDSQNSKAVSQSLSFY